jgi:hypothetical protein
MVMVRSVWLVCLVSLLGACGPDEAAAPNPPSLEAGPAVCTPGAARPEARHEPLIEALGLAPNVIKARAGALWVVQSGDNTIGRYDLASGAWDKAFVDVGNDENPYDVEVADGRVYVANYLGNSVSVADAASGEVLERWMHPSLQQPSAVAVTARRVYVGSVELRAPGDFGPGRITVFDRETGEFLASLEAAAPNPQFIRVLPTPAGERIVVVSTGGVKVEAGEVELVTAGAVEVWSEREDAAAPARVTIPVPLDPEQPLRGGLGAPSPTPDGKSWYFASATAPLLFKLDVASLRWSRGPDDPITFAPQAARSLHHATMLPNGVLAITSFNEDALYLWDTSCDKLLAGPVELGEAETRLEGPHGMAVQRAGSTLRLWYITSLSSALGRVELAL